jgi:hypothetical protein
VGFREITMRWSDISFRPPNRMLRQFAGLWIVFFGLMAFWQGYLHERTTLGWVLAALAITVGPLGLAWPQAVRWVYVAWMVLAFPIGWTISNGILALLFFVMFTPVALVFRLMGRDALGLKPKPDAATYWVEKPIITDPRRYLYQS